MISEKNKELAQWAMEFALKNGCHAAKVNIYSSENSTYKIRDTQIDKLQQASRAGLILSLYVDGRYSSYSTNRLDKKELKSFILNGISSTRYLAEDNCRVLPDSSRYYKGGLPDLQLYDPERKTLDPDRKVEIARNVVAEAYGKDERIVSVESSFTDGEESSYMITSNGFEGQSSSTRYNIYASVSIKGEGDARPSDGWYDSSLHFKDLQTEGIGQIALERTLRKLGQTKVASGMYPMIVDPISSGNLFYPVMQALMGGSLQQKNSFLLDKIGERVGSEYFTIVDDPHQVGMSGASYFDGEGVATEKRVIFEEGRLQNYFIDTYNAKKMEIAPTISYPSILTMKTGDKDMNGLIGNLKKGILVTGFNGGNCNSSTGDFSYGIEGFLIENGKLTQPISEMNITGNMISLWTNLIETGNDPIRKGNSLLIPSLLFDKVDFSGF